MNQTIFFATQEISIEVLNIHFKVRRNFFSYGAKSEWSPLQRDDFYRVEVSLSKEGEGEERARRRRQRKSLRRKNLRSRISIVCVLVVFGSSISLVRLTITVPVRK